MRSVAAILAHIFGGKNHPTKSPLAMDRHKLKGIGNFNAKLNENSGVRSVRVHCGPQ